MNWILLTLLKNVMRLFVVVWMHLENNKRLLRQRLHRPERQLKLHALALTNRLADRRPSPVK